MKQFTTNIAGFTVTNLNYIQMAKEISAKYGICPALNMLVSKCVENDPDVENSRKGLKNGWDKYIKLIGYTPAYFASYMRKIGPEYID